MKPKQRYDLHFRSVPDDTPTVFTITLDNVSQKALKDVPKLASKKLAKSEKSADDSTF